MGGMPALFLLVFRFVRLLLSGHQAVAIENAALRIQLAAFQRKRKRPLVTTCDRVFWITLRSLWSDWRHPLLYVQADTVVRWHAESFAERFRTLRAEYKLTSASQPNRQDDRLFVNHGHRLQVWECRGLRLEV